MMDKVSIFLNNITPDVLEPEDYVRWDKIEEKVNSLRREIALLQSIRYAPDPFHDLVNLLIEGPTILRVLKTLIAHTPDEIIFPDNRYINFKNDEKHLKLRKDKKRAEEISKMFFDLGLLPYLKKIESLRDIVRGVLVGLEPNSRKNRRGERFESLLSALIENTVNEINKEKQTKLQVVKQLKIFLKEETKTVDFAIKEINKVKVVVEANFYSTSGSKPSETLPRSYPEVERELKEKGIGLIVISDGKGWFKMKNAIKVMLDKLSYCFTIKQARDGKLKEAILKILKNSDEGNK